MHRELSHKTLYVSHLPEPFVRPDRPFVGSRETRRARLPILRRMNEQRGFTLIELMLTIVVMGVALAVAVPSWTTFIQNNRLTSQANTLTSSLLLARSEAIKQNRGVVLCPSTSGTDCTDSAWHEGWIVFVNRTTAGEVGTTNRDVDAGTGDACDFTDTSADGDCVLQIVQPLGDALTLDTGTAMEDWIEYSGTGAMLRGNNTIGDGLFVLCDDRGADHALGIEISTTGRPAVTDNNAGAALTCTL